VTQNEGGRNSVWNIVPFKRNCPGAHNRLLELIELFTGTKLSTFRIHVQSIREELEIKEANITKLLVYDKLTGAYSRTYFEQALEGFYERFALPAVIAMCDFNGLKLINDTFGHEKGDELLGDGVKIMLDSIGDENVIIRWGGDEFILIMPHMTFVEADQLIKKIKLGLNSFRPKTIPLDVSFGLSVIHSKGQEIGEAIKQAEDRMYSNKLTESKKTRMAVIEFLEKLLWEKDYQTEEHVMRLKSLVDIIGKEIGLSAREIVDLTQTAMLHDIGKIGVPVEILNKPGGLTPDEWNIMKKHSEIGYRITQSSIELAHISEAILGHHEWWDGNGYPQGLKGEEIPLYSRIVSIVDSYDVMTHDRPYKQTMNAADALAEINKWAGIQFDPYLASVFTGVMQEGIVPDA
ncbi:MAG: diguanylate cyclase, partial [Peptococcaceae bacterium]|nr:diguanylate cyclase [Peptococcaceae bacterium]